MTNMSTFDCRGNVNALLAGLGRTVGLEDLQLDEDDTCVIGVAGDSPIDLFYSEGEDAASITLATVIGEVAEGDRTALLTESLRANLYWRGTEGATLSLGPEDHLLLHRELPVEAGLDLVKLRSVLDSMIEVARAWQIYLDAHQPVLEDME